MQSEGFATKPRPTASGRGTSRGKSPRHISPARQTKTAESTMNIEQARFNMIEQQIRPWEVL
ncbi:MAG TPA: hypothetical protein VL689_19605, partial [Paraburkholderia sp.]|nr:hypothetical protein [Paraburkholderia sp.]